MLEELGTGWNSEWPQNEIIEGQMRGITQGIAGIIHGHFGKDGKQTRQAGGFQRTARNDCSEHTLGVKQEPAGEMTG